MKKERHIGLQAYWRDQDGKPSITRLLTTLIILSALFIVLRSVIKGIEISPNATALCEFLVTAGLSLMGVNSVGNRLINAKYQSNGKDKEEPQPIETESPAVAVIPLVPAQKSTSPVASGKSPTIKDLMKAPPPEENHEEEERR